MRRLTHSHLGPNNAAWIPGQIWFWIVHSYLTPAPFLPHVLFLAIVPCVPVLPWTQALPQASHLWMFSPPICYIHASRLLFLKSLSLLYYTDFHSVKHRRIIIIYENSPAHIISLSYTRRKKIINLSFDSMFPLLSMLFLGAIGTLVSISF